MSIDNQAIEKVLSQVIHPDSGDSIVALGMVENIRVEGTDIKLTLAFKKARDPFATSIKRACETAIEQAFPGFTIKGNILELVKESEPKKKAEKQVFDTLSGVKHRIAIASGKGGVGKSTVTSNLAVTLAKMGYKVGLIDADIYGPSMPKMFGLEDAMPIMVEVNGQELIEPVEKFGVKVISVGFFVKQEDALVWRGPMATNALRQIVQQVNWGNLDYLLFDLPPGTGDVHITLSTEFRPDGVIVVGTPQDVALADVVKGIKMFTSDNLHIPILGIVENMAWFTPAELPENKYYIFGKDGCKNLAQKYELPLLGQIPIVQSVCEGGDSGTPSALSNPIVAETFEQIAHGVVTELGKIS
ncbi:Mrp/NBP35 family ATP-binding protein [uncultured Acetobacteroides sp.]|uniref:Mrp/NBP35 family ATP-binding protein n=1 Tax=uncultured Acetobacteroides sp. TaxID=1760811 RepID=UPI0029F4CE5E|nr:Mrp/NBP35 family ATP-binding protein [uncultured Acetobacteroides sp.]